MSTAMLIWLASSQPLAPTVHGFIRPLLIWTLEVKNLAAESFGGLGNNKHDWR